MHVDAFRDEDVARMQVEELVQHRLKAGQEGTSTEHFDRMQQGPREQTPVKMCAHIAA